MFKTSLMAILVMLVLFPPVAHADFYKYLDEKGNIVFTDDLNTIPESKRAKAEKYDEPQTSKKYQQPLGEIAGSHSNNSNQHQSITTEEMNQKKEVLEKKQLQLKQEYDALMKEKAELEHQRTEAKGHNKKTKAYNQKILEFSEKLNKYNENRIALEAEVKEYNDTVEKMNIQKEKK